MQTIKAGSNMEHPRYKRVKGHPIACVGRNRTWRALMLPVDPYWVLHLLFLGTWPRNQVPGILVNRGEREPAVCRFCGKQTHTQHKQIIQHFTQAWMSSDASDLENIRGQSCIVRALTGTTSGQGAQGTARPTPVLLNIWPENGGVSSCSDINYAVP